MAEFDDFLGNLGASFDRVMGRVFNTDRLMGRLTGSANNARQGGVQETNLPPIGANSPPQTPGAPSRPAGSQVDIARQAYRYFLDKGLTPDQAEAWAGNFGWESGGRTDNVRDNDNPAYPNAPHSAGVGQWNGDRLARLFQSARARGIDIPEGDLRDPNYVRQSIAKVPLSVQLDYAWDEANSTERRAFTGITSGRDARSANLGAVSYFRPRGWTAQNPAGAEAFENRLNLGRRARVDESRMEMQDRSGDAGNAPDPAMMPAPAPMGSTGPSMAGVSPSPNAAFTPQFQPNTGPGVGARPDPFAGLTIPQTARREGSVGGALDRLMGLPQREDLMNTYNATRSAEEREGLAEMTRRAGELSAANPNLQPQQLFSMMLRDPQIGSALGRVGPNGVTTLQTLASNAGRPPPQHMPGTPGSTPLAFDPVTGQATQAGPTLPPADVLETQYEMNLYRTNPDEFARYMAIKRMRTGSQNVRPTAEVVTGGSPRAAALGITGLKPGERAEVKFERDPATGLDRMTDINFPDRPTVDLTAFANQEEIRRLVQERAKITERQSAVISAARIAERINDQLDVTGETGQGALGVLTRVAEGVTAQAVDAARLAGVKLDPTAYSSALKPFVAAGANSSATQSNIMALAFMLARAQNPTGQVTQRDLESALTQLGSGLTGSSNQMRAALKEMMNNAINGVDDVVTVRGPEFSGGPVSAPRPTRQLLEDLGLRRYSAVPAPPARPRSTEQRTFEPGEINRMQLGDITKIEPSTLNDRDRLLVWRRFQLLKQAARERSADDPNPAIPPSE